MAGVVGGDVLAVVVSLIAFFLVLVGYPAVMETFWNGRTLGKAAMGLRVVTREGAPERFRHAAIRSMIGLVEIYLLLGIPAVISIVTSRRDQRLGDLVAGTLVLRQRAGRRAAPPVAFGVPWNWEAYVQGLDVSPITDEQYGVVRAVLLRLGELTPAARWQVTTEVATAVAGQMRIPVPVQVAPGHVPHLRGHRLPAPPRPLTPAPPGAASGGGVTGAAVSLAARERLPRPCGHHADAPRGHRRHVAVPRRALRQPLGRPPHGPRRPAGHRRRP